MAVIAAFALASSMAARNEPGPVSAVFVTNRVAAAAGAAARPSTATYITV
jgi:hypothetical protein